MQVRYSTSPTSAETATTADLRDSFLVQDLFVTGEVNATYTHEDRMVVGGAVPGTGQLDLPAYADVLGTESHLERRELGVINVGRAGHVVVDGEKFELEHLDGLYVGRGSEVSFAGAEAAFYFIYAPFLPQGVIGLATAGWRFLTFYLQLGIASVIFFFLPLPRTAAPPEGAAAR